VTSSRKLAIILAEYESRIHTFFSRRCGNWHDVEDLVQEALCAIVAGYSRFEHKSSLSTWIYAICRNIYSNYQYYGARQRKTVSAVCNVCDEGNRYSVLELRLEIDKMPSEDIELYSLFYIQGFPIRQIAIYLEKPEGTVKYLLHRLRKHIKDKLV
jgi:RNA polymerase sigma-70 factor, ECF subfamily